MPYGIADPYQDSTFGGGPVSRPARPKKTIHAFKTPQSKDQVHQGITFGPKGHRGRVTASGGLIEHATLKG